jgi:hypothetical protein
MTRNRFALLTCLAVALSAPAFGFSGGSDDHGGGAYYGGTTATGSQTSDDHGHDGQTGSQGADDHGNDGQGASLGRNQVSLATQQAGAAFGVSGNADLRAFGAEQRIKVEIEGNFADGTQFQVFANGLPIGSIIGHLQHGELEIELENGTTLPGGLLPSAINSIEVRDLAGNSLLVGRFAALSGVTSSAPASGVSVSKTEAALTAVSAAATSVAAAGSVELRSQGVQQELHIRVDAAVADGTTWAVFANGIQIGTLKFRLGAAELKMESEDALPAGLGSLAAISTVNITDGTSTLLSAKLK